jgi:phage-related protein
MRVTIHHDVEVFINTFDSSTIAKTLRTIDLLERFGPALRLPHSKPVAKGLFELRTRGQQEVRILYTFHQGSAVLLHGFVKKSAKMPAKELRVGLAKMQHLT